MNDLPTESVIRAKLSALIIEDDPIVAQDHAKCALTRRYVDILEIARTGAAALKLLQMVRFDIVLLDLSLPDMNGMDVLKRLRELDPRVPVLVITGWTNPEIEREVLSHGAVYLQKPVDVATLRKYLNGICHLIREGKTASSIRTIPGAAETPQTGSDC